MTTPAAPLSRVVLLTNTGGSAALALAVATTAQVAGARVISLPGYDPRTDPAAIRSPQKLLELHEFRLSMIQDVAQLDTSNDDLAFVINMDGQGSPRTKQATWQAVVAGAPRGVFLGWKNFCVKDTPMLGPQDTILQTPMPVLISYE